jgi:hypothetical protein
MQRCAFLLVLGLWACGGEPVERERDVESTGDETTSERTSERPAPSARDLSAAATFSDLASAARRQDDLRDQDSSAGCLLRRGEGFRLEADLAVAIRPLPAPETDLDARMASDGPARVLTRYGAYGESDDLALVALTTTAPPRGTIEGAVGMVIVITDRGAYARRTDTAFGAVTPRPLGELIGTLPYTEVSTTFVTAEAGVPLTTVHDALRLLPSTLAGDVGLAVALERGVVLPDRVALEDDGAPLCDGLPATEAPSSDAFGASSLREGMSRLSGPVAICVGTTAGPGARGGRMELMARIIDGGTVGEACIRADDTGDAHLRACVLRAARALVFADPDGVVDFAVPLVLEPGTIHRQRATCE